MRKILAILGLFVVLAGMVFAMSGAGVESVVNKTRWEGQIAESHVTEGGNISHVNVSLDSLTEKWAAFFGNVSGGLELRDNVSTNNVYSWSWAATSGGEVCVSQAPAFVWANAEAAIRADIDTAWSFGSAADNAANTFTDADGTITFDQSGPVTTANVTLDSGFITYVIGDGTETAEDDFAFCTEMDNAGTNYEGEPAHYEIMVPTSNGSTDTETYYFYAELN